MYNSNAFRNFLTAQAKTYGSQYKSYAEEFKNYDDEELLRKIDSNAGQMRHYADDITSDTFNDYVNELQRMIECIKLRQEFRQEMIDDELVDIEELL
jgi:hypothetical protein